MTLLWTSQIGETESNYIAFVTEHFIDRKREKQHSYSTLFRLGGGGAFDASQGLNPLLLTNDCVYSVPTS